MIYAYNPENVPDEVCKDNLKIKIFFLKGNCL